jgi:hypothetical protein
LGGLGLLLGALWRRPFRKPCVYPSQDLRTS